MRASLRGSSVPPAGIRRLPYGYATYQPRQPTTYKRTPLRRVIKTVSAYIVLSFLLQLALSAIVLVYGATIVVPEIMDSWEGVSLFLVLPVMVNIVTLSGSALLAYYFLLIAAILASCAYFFAKGAGPYFRELRMTAKSREHSIIFATVGLLFATVFFSLVIALLASPSEDELPEAATTAEYLFLLANASVWEEVIVRVLMIGLPMLLVDLARRRWQTRLRSYVLGGGFRMGMPEVSLLVASSVIFGVAHFTSGWGAWKILPATVGGLAFGYLFLRYGIAASITMHFGTDYLTMPIEVSDSFGLAVITGIGIVVWASFGLIFFAYYTVRVIEFLSGTRLFEPVPAPEPLTVTWPYVPPVPPPPSDGQWPGDQRPVAPGGMVRTDTTIPPPRKGSVVGGYVCPRCGGVEARWKDGRFECLRCGFQS